MTCVGSEASECPGRRDRRATTRTRHEIVISRLKPDQRAYLARANNVKTIRKHLARTYSSLLQESGNLRIKIQGQRLEPRRHCIWDADRTVELPSGTIARAVERINISLAPRQYCVHCMQDTGERQ